MKKQVLFGGILVAIASSSQAAPSSYGPIGPNIAYGDASNSNTIYSPLANPAYNALNKSDTEGYRFGLGVSGQISLESKGLENFVDNFDNKIKPVLDNPSSTTQTQFENLINSYFNQYNKGQLNANAGVTIPLLVKSGFLSGGISLDYTQQHASNMTLIKNSDINATIVGSNISITQGGVGLGVTYKKLDEFSLGYGTNIFSNNSSSLAVGVNARYLSLLSNTKAIDFQKVINDNLGSNSKDIKDYVKNIDQGSSDSAITADVGINWIHENYSLGVVGMNLTSPKFKVNNISEGNDGANFASYIKSDFKLKPQYRIAGQLNTASRHWTIAGSYDLVKANDLNDQDTQWWSASVSYATNSAWYIPDVRAGMRGNMVGNKYTYTDVGLTFGFLNVDVATTTTDISGTLDKQKDAGLIASLGVEFDF